MIEYLVAGLPVPPDLDKDSIMFHGWMEDVLNNFGKDTWECYQVQFLTSSVRVFLKREVKTVILSQKQVLASIIDDDHLMGLGGKVMNDCLINYCDPGEALKMGLKAIIEYLTDRAAFDEMMEDLMPD